MGREERVGFAPQKPCMRPQETSASNDMRFQRGAMERVRLTISIIILSMASIIVFMLSGTADAAVIPVSPNQSIQAAIDCARPGDTIEVLGGCYRENVNITRSLALRGRGGPVVDAGGKGCAITLFARGIT
jgi:hypothetical protein